jgi:hypothetical protein
VADAPGALPPMLMTAAIREARLFSARNNPSRSYGPDQPDLIVAGQPTSERRRDQIEPYACGLAGRLITVSSYRNGQLCRGLCEYIGRNRLIEFAMCWQWPGWLP